jgi:sortase A
VTFSRALERVLFFVGLALCVYFVGSLAYRALASQATVRSFEESNRGKHATAVHKEFAQRPIQVNHSLWSEKRITAYIDSLTPKFPPPLAVLRLPSANIEVPVFDGTDELALNRGVGRIAGTALPGDPGNVGIAGHRDGFFRGLKDVAAGDLLTLTTVNETLTYVVEGAAIVSPDDVGVLAYTPRPSVTLVTCYPFYFIGHAPRRYIVRCSLRERVSNKTPKGGPRMNSSIWKSGD